MDEYGTGLDGSREPIVHAETALHEVRRTQTFAQFFVAYGAFWFAPVLLVPDTGVWLHTVVITGMAGYVYARVRYERRQPVVGRRNRWARRAIDAWTVGAYPLLLGIVEPHWLSGAALGWAALAGLIVAVPCFAEALRLWLSDRQ